MPLKRGSRRTSPTRTLACPPKVGWNSAVIRGAGIVAKLSSPAPDSTCSRYSSPRSSTPL